MKNILKKLKNPKIFRPLLVVLISTGIVTGLFFYFKMVNRVSIENSTVSAPIITISPTTAGTLKQVFVVEGQTVKKGDALAAVGSEILYAYTGGIITATNKQFGSIASAQTAVVTMINSSEMRIDGSLDENKGLRDVKIGQPVSFTVDALPGKTFWGYVDEVASTAKQTQAAFSISSERPTQQFEVYARFDASHNPEIKNGMSAKMTVYTK
ncbi:HlyD family efflux transporter periplasmic adaptor subunit [Candidatus Roizmanbacteria bacterium]|nr:HlyD family efflux transporter periplasmic adaptor subunit [Candidatus Roizmanbacteria bacterium]